MEEKEPNNRLYKSQSIDSDRIVNKEAVQEDYSCKICLNLSLDIEECQNCQNIFCLECIEDWRKKQTNTCPFKCTPWKLGKAHRIYRNTIANTKICCENQKLENGQDGCQEVFPFEKIDIHQNQECKFRKVVCQNNGCKRQLLFKDLEAHDKICEYKQLPCEMCGILKAIQNDHNCVQQLSLKINYLEKKMEKMYTKEEVDQKLKGYVSVDYFKRYQEAVEKKIAAIINQDFLGEIKHQQFKCPNDHDLKKITLNHPNIKNLICDLCGNRPYEKRSPSFRCDICDFDKCQQCIKN